MKTLRKNKSKKIKKVDNRLLEGFREILPTVKSEHFLKWMNLKYSGFKLFNILDDEGKAGTYTDLLVLPDYLNDAVKFRANIQSCFDYYLTLALAELLMYVEQIEKYKSIETDKFYLDKHRENVLDITFKDITYKCIDCGNKSDRMANNVCISCFEKKHENKRRSNAN